MARHHLELHREPPLCPQARHPTAHVTRTTYMAGISFGTCLLPSTDLVRACYQARNRGVKNKGEKSTNYFGFLNFKWNLAVILMFPTSRLVVRPDVSHASLTPK